MIKLNPFWKEVPVTKEFKKQYKKQTGLNADRMIVANDKYFDLLERLFTKKT